MRLQIPSAQPSWPLTVSPHRSHLEAAAGSIQQDREISYLCFALSLSHPFPSCCILFAFEEGAYILCIIVFPFSTALQALGDITIFWVTGLLRSEQPPHPNNFHHNSASQACSLFPWCQTGQKCPPPHPVVCSFIPPTRFNSGSTARAATSLDLEITICWSFRGMSTNSLIILPLETEF